MSHLLVADRAETMLECSGQRVPGASIMARTLLRACRHLQPGHRCTPVPVRLAVPGLSINLGRPGRNESPAIHHPLSGGDHLQGGGGTSCTSPAQKKPPELNMTSPLFAVPVRSTSYNLDVLDTRKTTSLSLDASPTTPPRGHNRWILTPCVCPRPSAPV